MTESPSTATATAADRLEAGIADVHVPQPSADSEALLLKLGVILPVVGVVLILAAWWSASGSKYVADQMPMLISGGLFGLALIIIGLGLFIRFSLARLLRFWLARLVVEQQAQTDRLVDALARVESAVRDATTDAPVIVQVNDQT
ncbi:MAG: hypothetical protein JWM47_923 [Acidimicrobiales bacterium]|nr:hypothetical protein [Acidimicrobiales bacterium]